MPRRRSRTTSTCAYLLAPKGKTSNSRHRSEAMSVRLTAARHIERHGDALALAEWPRTVPHPRGEQRQQCRHGLDQPARGQVDSEPRLRFAEREPARIDPGAEVRRQDDIECRAEPPHRVEVVGVVPALL